jgi:flavorubredoxin
MVFSFISGVIKGFNNFAQKEAQNEHMEELLHYVREEKHNGRNYWFDAKTETFLAWGDTQADVIAALKIRWPDHMFYLSLTSEIICGPDWTPVPRSMDN